MSTIPSPLVADWIERELKWKYIVKDISKSYNLPAGSEKKIGKYLNPEGLFLYGVFEFDRPFGGVRIDAYPEWPDSIDIPTLYRLGVRAPNIWGWLSSYIPDPYAGLPGNYTIVIPQGQVWQNTFELFVHNLNANIAINCTYHKYVMVVLEQARSMTEAERFEEETGN